MTAGFKVSDVQEAEAVYREFIFAYWQASAKDTRTSDSEQLLSLTDPPFRSSVQAAIKFQLEEGIVVASGHGSVISTRPAAGKEILDSVVALDVCTDERAMLLERRDGATTHGKITREIAYFHRSPQGTLKYFANQSLKDSDACLN